MYDNKVNTNFQGKEKVGKVGKKYYPQVFFR